MSEETANLSTSLNRLGLLDGGQPQDLVLAAPAPNVFMRRRRSKSLSSINFGTSCDCKKPSVKHTTTFKKTWPKHKVLREPVLRLLKCRHSDGKKEKLFGQVGKKKDDLDFRTILDACEQLSLDGIGGGAVAGNTESFLVARTASGAGQKVEVSSGSNVGSTTCSHQARMNVSTPCDVTIDELASYFETFVHIPKKMSSMAEMMYI